MALVKKQLPKSCFNEQEKTIALDNALVIEKKGFKVQEDLLKELEIEILSLRKSQAKEELIVDELTRESFLSSDACNNLEGENLELQKNFESLRASHIALEVQLDNLKNNATINFNDALSNSKASKSNGWSRSYEICINACATNIAEMNAMKKEFARLSHSLIDEKKKSQREVSLRTTPKALGQAT
jgi:hypothetical protein